MQITHRGGERLAPNQPEKLPVKDVIVRCHPSGMIADHDYSCSVCRDNHAILDLSNGLMQPCRPCQKNGYRLVKHKESFLKVIFKGFLK